MRKVHLLTTVAAGLLLATAAGAADNSDQKSKSEMSNPAPAAQQAAPAEKVAPSMKAGERKTPETTGQATKSDDKAKPDLKASDGGKAGMKAEEKKNPETTGAVKENTEKSGAAQKSTRIDHRPRRRGRFRQALDRAAQQDHQRHPPAESDAGAAERLGERRHAHSRRACISTRCRKKWW